ncbi:hypothetical protein SCLCIDRAFT_121116, partial [Scleroderma citrinum Foug A]
LRSVSYDFGAPKAGTPKADEWRTLITIYIPLALISLWGDGMAHKSKNIDVQLCQALDHTMALVQAVYITCARSMTIKRAIAYRSFVSTWVSQLKILHPAVDHHPNCHMSIPIYKFLLSFGLVRSWWCFPFEHLIGQLQHLPTNNKFSTC